jgi:hypothetical protein
MSNFDFSKLNLSDEDLKALKASVLSSVTKEEAIAAHNAIATRDTQRANDLASMVAELIGDMDVKSSDMPSNGSVVVICTFKQTESGVTTDASLGASNEVTGSVRKRAVGAGGTKSPGQTMADMGLQVGDKVVTTKYGKLYDLTILNADAGQVSFGSKTTSFSGAGRAVLASNGKFSESCHGSKFWMGDASTKVVRNGVEHKVVVTADGWKVQ